MNNWETGNAYQFEVHERGEHRDCLVTNVHYGISLTNPREAYVVAKVLNDVQIGNGDGISKKKLNQELSSMEKDYLSHDGITLSEAVLVKQIFRNIKGLIK